MNFSDRRWNIGIYIVGLREKQVDKNLRPWFERVALKAWAFVAGCPTLYRWGTWFGVRYLKWLAGGKRWIPVLGRAPEWTKGRDFPAPEGKTFRELYARRKAGA